MGTKSWNSPQFWKGLIALKVEAHEEATRYLNFEI